MFSIFSDIEISEMLIPRNIYFFEHAVLKNMTVCSVWYFSIPVFYYSILSTKYHMIDLEVFSWSSLRFHYSICLSLSCSLNHFKRLNHLTSHYDWTESFKRLIDSFRNESQTLKMLWLFAIIFCRRNGAKTGNKSLDISLLFIELLYKSVSHL